MTDLLPLTHAVRQIYCICITFSHPQVTVLGCCRWNRTNFMQMESKVWICLFCPFKQRGKEGQWSCILIEPAGEEH